MCRIWATVVSGSWSMLYAHDVLPVPVNTFTPELFCLRGGAPSTPIE